jgi:putative DNA methylase
MDEMSTARKKLIEVGMPLAGIDEPAARLKQKAPKGYPTRLHKWWAQTPVSAARAVLFAQLVDDPSAWPDRFPTEEDQARERDRLFSIMVGNFDPKSERWGNGITDWATPGVPRALEDARYEIAKCLAWSRHEEPPKVPSEVIKYLQAHGPTILDPFCGSGTIPLEAQRLGLRSIGSDLNPVAVLISKTLVEIPPKFAGYPPVNPEARKRLNGAASWQASGAQGLAEDVRYYGKWMHDEAGKRIGRLYPQVEVTAEAVRQQPDLKPLKGKKLNVIAWLWARTVTSPNPAAKGAQVPLVSSFMLSTKEGKKAWVEPVTDPDARHGYRFEVHSGRLSKAEEEKAKAGTIGRSTGGSCILTGTPMPFTYVREQGKSAGLGVRLMAIIAEGQRGRVYLPPVLEQEELAASARPEWLPEGDLPNNPRDFKTPNYGMPTFADLFTPRQLVALTTFSDLVSEAREKALADAQAARLPSGPRLADDGTGAEAYADAIAISLSMALSRHLQFGSAQSTWYVKDQAVKGLPQQAMPMVWDFCEASPFGDSSANFANCTSIAADCLATAPAIGVSAITQRPAQQCDEVLSNPIVISTDPPYYDNVGYADLSDFFHEWLRRSLRKVLPHLTATVATPKSDELVATPYRDRDGLDPDEYWLKGMCSALQCLYRASGSAPTTIYYAYKNQEKKGSAEQSVFKGWTTFLQAVHDAGFAIDGTWPMRVNNPGRKIAQGTSALASAVVLVCRKRPANAPITTRSAFLSSLRRELPTALKIFQTSNIAPVDLAQASIGPGMGIFTRHQKVLEADDSTMTVETAWSLINQVLIELLSEQVGDFDVETQYATTWFEEFGLEEGIYDAAERLAKARNISVRAMEEAGVLKKRADKVRLKKRSEMSADWHPDDDKTPTVWECAQHLIRVLESDGESATAVLLAKLGSHADATRDLAYRLYQICERKKWAEEARAYNGLVVAWPELQKLAAQRATPVAEMPAQGALL